MYSEPIEEDKTGITEIPEKGKDSKIKEKREGITHSPSINIPFRNESPVKGTLNKKTDDEFYFPLEEITTQEYETDLEISTQIQEASTTDDQTLGTLEASNVDETTASTEETNKEVEDLLHRTASFLRSILKTLEAKNFTKIYKPSLPGVPWIIDTVPKRTKRSVSNFLETCSTSLPCPRRGLFRLNDSCTKYYECRFSPKCHKLAPKIRTCPKCLKFNAQVGICDLPEHVPECSSLSSQTVCTGPGRFSVPHDCQKYYECRKLNDTMVLKVKTCPPSMVFSHKERQCVKGKKCRKHVPTCGHGKSFLSDKFNCSVYYHCNNANQLVPLVCPAGLIFNGHVCEKWEESKLNWNKRSDDRKVIRPDLF